MNRSATTVLGTVLLAGRTTLTTVENAPQPAGASRLFSADRTAALTSLHLVLSDMGFPVKGERGTGERETVVLASHSAGDPHPDLTDGYVARITLSDRAKGTEVRVLCEYAYKLKIGPNGGPEATDRENEILNRIGDHLIGP